MYTVETNILFFQFYSDELMLGVLDMNNEYFAEMHKLSEKAKVLERMGREEEALKLYLEIHANYFPNTSDLYERPAIILEKRKRFDEAIHICEKAIKFINEGKMTGIKETFSRRIDRITSRSDYQGAYSANKGKKKVDNISEEPSVAKIEKKPREPKKPREAKKPREPREPREKFVFPKLNIPTFRMPKFVLPTWRLPKIDFSKIKLPKIDKEALVISINELKMSLKASFKKMRKPSKTEMIALLVIVSFIAAGVYILNNKPKSQFEIMLDMSKFEHTSQVDGNPFENNIKDLPPITSSMIAKAVKEAESMMGVQQAGVILQKDTVGFVLMLEPGTSKGQAKDAAEVFVKALGSAAASENSELSGPGIIGYGELFDHYYLIVAAGENFDNLLLKGTKNPRIIGIYWK